MPGEVGRHETATELHRLESLREIEALIEMPSARIEDGWSTESARLFAIDTAMLVARRHMSDLVESDRLFLMIKLNEARRLVVDDRDQELEWIQGEFGSFLGSPAIHTRHIWLTVLNSMLPSPYRAAVATVAAALSTSDVIDDLSATLRDRLIARLGEGALLRQETGEIFAIA